jgi:hypothetical protein
MHRDGQIDWRFVTDDRGEQALCDMLNDMLDAINQNRPSDGPNTYLDRSAQGTSVRTKGASGSSVAPYPYQGQNASDATAPKVTVNFGTHNNVPPQIDSVDLVPPIGTPIPKLTLSPTDLIVYVEFDFVFNWLQQITSYTRRTIQSSGSSTPPANSLTFADDGSGTGSFYQTLFATQITAPTGTGPYIVKPIPNIKASQTFYICAGNIIF